MEQGQYCWMQATNKRKLFSMGSNLITSPPPTTTTTSNNPSYDDDLSWEEQAFAEDAAAGSLGGCIWPPRSYSCSFCRREFRSAQALGGHMNVHRRDRARLKQPSSPSKSNNNEANPFTSNLGSYNNFYPPPVCGFVCNIKANPNSDLDVIASASASSSPSPSPNSNPLLLAPPSSSVKGLTCNSSSIVHKTSESWSTLGGDHHHHHRLCSNKFYPEAMAGCELFNCHPHPLSPKILAKKKLYPEADFEKVSKGLLLDSRCRDKGNDNEDGDDADMPVSLNLVICRTNKPLQFETKEDEDINCKRMKTDSSSSIQFLPKSSSSSVVDHHRHHQVQPKVFELSPSSIEELDLELRLGNKSKV